MKKILITGANGLIGTRLQQMLLAAGYEINTIGRTAKATGNKRTKAYTWDIANCTMDIKALDGVDAIVHLAGAGVADERWTEKRKKEILDSRIDSTELLFKTLSTTSHQVTTIVSASAVGYYGDCGAELVAESHKPADTYLAEVVQKWEASVSKMAILGIRHVCCRIGIVLAKDGGALPELTKTIPLGVAGYFAKSPLYYPWVHIDDVCGIMIHSIENGKVKGSYNTTAHTPAQIKELMQAIVSVKRSHAVLVPVPSFALHIMLGEMADMLLDSQRCTDEKIRKTGYKFHFPELKAALENIYGS